MTNNLCIAFLTSFILLLTSCNVLAPFAANSSDEDKIEEGQQCLHDADYDCAIENYDKISDAKLRLQKLCMAYLSKSGFTLSNLINTSTTGESDILGKLAAGLLPHTESRFAAADDGKKVCLEYFDAEPTLSLAALLKTMALFNHCAARIAKTDVFLATSDADTQCITPGDNNGVLSKSEVSDNADGTIAVKGMCKLDADTCRDDIVLINPSNLGNETLQNIKKGYDALPAPLKDPNSTTAAIRVSLRDTLP